MTALILSLLVCCQTLPVKPDAAAVPPATKTGDGVTPRRPPSKPKGPAVPVTKETQVVEAPGPTVSPAFGNVLAFAGDRLVISGAVLSRRGGAEGQIFTFAIKDGKWTSISEMVQVQAMAPEEFAIQRILGDPEFLLTNIVRKTKSSEIISYAPAEGREAWKQSGSIKAPANEKVMNFGAAMALSGNLLAVSEVSSRPNQKDEDFSTNPRVFIFVRTPEGWKAEGAIRRDAERTPWWFGISIALDGDTLAVANPMGLLPFTTDKVRTSLEPAMVCVYRKGPEGWKLEQEIQNFGLSPYQGFGVNIAMKGDLLAVRSVNPYNRDDEIDVSVLRRVNGHWESEGALQPGAGVTKGKGYGFAMAIDQGRIIVGDATAVEGSDTNGRAYVFEKGENGWQEKWRLAPKVFVSPNSFGSAIAMQWPWVAVGRIRNERLGIEPGGALLYKLDAGAAPTSPAKPGE
ncbi:MAG: hypothetical protein K8R92_04410 [Planctomycetes bacterium]|nr:hypothetical protein [Planctomycetota bacterium]